MSYSMQDIVPWSLIYSAQNEKHESEMKLMQDKLNNEKTRSHHLAYMMIVNLLNASREDVNVSDSDPWKQFNSVVDIIMKEDIDNAVVEVVIELRAFCSIDFDIRHSITEIHRRAQICKSRLPYLKR